MKFVVILEKQNKLFWSFAGILLVAVIGVIDVMTSYQITFYLFYLIPILLVTWYAGKWFGIAAAILSTLSIIVTDIISGNPLYANSAIFYWNSIVTLGTFLIMILLLSTLKNAFVREKELARADSLTGAINNRYFFELMQREVDRFRRYGRPFTVAYIDLDNFKSINDQFGHRKGDEVLSTIVKKAKSQLRSSDVVARLGGDEFAILLLETNQAAAQMAVSKIQCGLEEEMQSNKWPVTFSMGVISCLNAPSSVDEVIDLADELMYSVKKNGKNSVKYSVYSG